MASLASYEVTPEDRRHLETQGYFVPRYRLPVELVADFRRDVLNLWREEVERAGGDNASTQVRTRPFIDRLHERSRPALKLLRSPFLTGLAKQIVGEDVDVCFDQAVIKAPTADHSTAFPWHQDARYQQNVPDWDRNMVQEDATYFQMWIALTDATPENGALQVLPGEHRKGLILHDARASGDLDLSDHCDISAAVTLELKAGEAVIFSGLLPHGTGPNKTSSPRIAYQLTCAPQGTRSGDEQLPLLRGGTLIDGTPREQR